MKKIFSFLMLCIFTTTSVLAQEFIESVYLKDGSVIKGDIIEVKPNQYLKIEADNGNSIICQYSEIDKITRERTENLTSSHSSCRGYLTRGYRWFIQGEFMALELLGGAILQWRQTCPRRLTNRREYGLGLCGKNQRRSCQQSTQC